MSTSPQRSTTSASAASSTACSTRWPRTCAAPPERSGGVYGESIPIGENPRARAARLGEGFIVTAAARSRRLPQLDGLRGLAAMAVVLYHAHMVFGLTLGFERAYLFVDLFFLLSGFVLGLAWAPDGARGGDTGALLAARLRRLWPTIAAAAVVGAAVHLALGDTPRLEQALLLTLLLVPAVWQADTLFPLNGPQWSLLWELLANVAHLLWLRRAGRGVLLAVALAMALALAAAIRACGADDFGTNGAGWWLALPRVGWSYTAGLLVADLYRTADWRPVLRWWQALALPLLAVLLLPRLPLSAATGDTLLVLAVFPALFWLLVTARAPARTGGWLGALGASSFPLYAVHLPVLMLVVALDLPRAEAAALAVAAALLLASGWSIAAARARPARGNRVAPLPVAG